MSTARATHPVQGFARPMGISPMKGPTYNGAELATKPARTTTGNEHPTRVGARLRWGDGRVTDLDGMPITEVAAPAPVAEVRPYWPAVPARAMQEAPPAPQAPNKPLRRTLPATQFAPPAPPAPPVPVPVAAPAPQPPRPRAVDKSEMAKVLAELDRASTDMAALVTAFEKANKALENLCRRAIELQEYLPHD